MTMTIMAGVTVCLSHSTGTRGSSWVRGLILEELPWPSSASRRSMGGARPPSLGTQRRGRDCRAVLARMGDVDKSSGRVERRRWHLQCPPRQGNICDKLVMSCGLDRKKGFICPASKASGQPSKLMTISHAGQCSHFKAVCDLNCDRSSSRCLHPHGTHGTGSGVTRAFGSADPGNLDSQVSKNYKWGPPFDDDSSTSSDSRRGCFPCMEANLSPFDDALARLVVIVGKGSLSPFDGVPWEEVMIHTGQRLRWINPKFRTDVFTDDVLRENVQECNSDELQDFKQQFKSVMLKADIVVAVEVHDEEPVMHLAKKVRQSVATFLALDSGLELLSCVCLGGVRLTPMQGDVSARMQDGGKVEEEEAEWQTVAKSLAMALPWTSTARKMKGAQHMRETVQQAWGRRKPDDVLFVLMLLIDSYVTEIPQLKNLRANNLSALWCMITKCGPKIAACLADPTCSKALECLNNCPPNDQVCSYKCIVSYESPLLEDFSLCILQKHNCLGLSAEIPLAPDVQPMTSFGGQQLTHEIAEDLFIGWLGEKEYSWRVVAGQNAAYDQFPCQYQLFYRGKSQNSMWYDPVFQVRTLDGRVVWRRRHYRVRRAQVPGTFHFSTLDNGVVSLEYWRIVDVAEDLSWGLFYYAGAATAAGQTYTGAVLCTLDGKWPGEEREDRVLRALESAGIKRWEMYRVDNSCCQEVPLGLDSKVGINPLSPSLRLPAMLSVASVNVNSPL